MQRILVTGATGQIGSELIPALRQRYGPDSVVAAGHKREPEGALLDSGPYVVFDVCQRTALEEVVARYKIDTIYHLAALLSATAEVQPERAWDINVNGLFNVLEVARVHGCALFHPSSIGAFGPSTPRDNTPQETIQRPATIYGIAKVTGELLCDYYYSKFGVDTRGLRYPGLISYKTPPGGGTTDYAVEIFYSALKDGRYTCFLDAATRLGMMFMPDAIRAAIELMEVDASRLRYRNAYNLSAMSLTPAELGQAIKERIPGFVMRYEVDPLRQAIADSWPNRVDDSAARSEWGWRPEYDLERMTTVMLARLSAKLMAS